MSTAHMLYLKDQKGTLELDEKACYTELAAACWELLQQHHKDDSIPQHMFRIKSGKLEIYGGGCDEEEPKEEEELWGDHMNTWGYAEEWILDGLANNLKGDGELLFATSTEGWPPNVYKVSPGKVQKIA